LEQNMQTQTFTPNLNRPFFKKSISNLNINSNEINFKLQSPKPNYKFKIIASGILLTGIKIGIMICMYNMSKNE
jgi:hypothetical protein